MPARYGFVQLSVAKHATVTFLLDADRFIGTDSQLMTRNARQAIEWHRIIRGEYAESPGLRLTLCDAQRLWGLERAYCEALLDALVEVRFLRRTKDGAYIHNHSRG